MLNLTSLFTIANIYGLGGSIRLSDNSDDIFTFDGNITEGEWDDRYFVGKYYMDVENGDGDKDCYNYLYMGRDSSNLYIAYDFISDQTDNPTGEWIGLWFNTQESTFDTDQAWYDLLDISTESLLYDVDNNEVFPFFSTGYNYHPNWVNDDSEITIQYGVKNMSADYMDLRNYGSDYYEVNSTLVNSNYTYWINFSIDITKWFTIFPELFLNNISLFQLRIDTILNTTIAEHKIILWYPNGTLPDFNDLNQVVNISRLSGAGQKIFNIGIGNLTTDNKLRFTLFGNNSAGFQNLIDYIRLWARTANTAPAGCVNYPYSSIKTHEIKWSFFSSPNNASYHRMFEISIPLSELENYDVNKELGVFIAGYGTCGFVDTDYWCIPVPPGDPQVYDGIFNSTRYLYITVNTIETPGGPEGIDPLLIILAIVIPGSIGGVMIGLGLYFKKHPDKLKKFVKKLR